LDDGLNGASDDAERSRQRCLRFPAAISLPNLSDFGPCKFSDRVAFPKLVCAVSQPIMLVMKSRVPPQILDAVHRTGGGIVVA
jgi:hypothetical protein